MFGVGIGELVIILLVSLGVFSKDDIKYYFRLQEYIKNQLSSIYNMHYKKEFPGIEEFSTDKMFIKGVDGEMHEAFIRKDTIKP